MFESSQNGSFSVTFNQNNGFIMDPPLTIYKLFSFISFLYYSNTMNKFDRFVSLLFGKNFEFLLTILHTYHTNCNDEIENKRMVWDI